MTSPVYPGWKGGNRHYNIYQESNDYALTIYGTGGFADVL